MSTNDIQVGDGPTLTSCSRIFGKIALVPFLAGMVVLACTAAWAPESDIGWLTALACLLMTIALVTLLVPLIVILVYYAIIIPLALALFVACDEIPFPGWPGRVRTLLRYLIILTCGVCVLWTVPRLCVSPTWNAFMDTALAGIVMPAGVILWMFIFRFEGTGKAGAEVDRPAIR